MNDPIRLCKPVSQGAVVSPMLFGCNLEHTRSSIYTGLSAQMLRNRKFVGKPSACSGHAMQWYAIGEKALLCFEKPYTHHHELYHMKRSHECNAQQMVNAYEGMLCGIGQHELSVQAGKTCVVRIVAKTSAPVRLTAAITSRHGRCTYARVDFELDSTDWKTYEAEITSAVSDEDADFRLTFTAKASVTLGVASLMPADAFRGMRRDVIARLREAGIRVLRWPGGNFAGEYNWLDGLLPVDERAPFESYLGLETQPHTMGYDMHEIDTDDFIALCREVGAEPFITINPCWNTPEENAAWVEYCNGGADTPYGSLRAMRGHAEPYQVRLWSLGNEAGYGHMEGDNTPEGYARIARENARHMLAVSPDLMLCSSGPYPNAEWAQKSAYALRGVAQLSSQHFYSHNPRYPDAENFEAEYCAALNGVEILRQQIRQNRADLPAETKISMDEWNVWYAWYRPSSVTDGMFTALAFHMLMAEAEPCGMEVACHFEAINEGVIRVLPHDCHFTAQGQVFTVMKHHVGGVLCHSAPEALVTRKDDVLTATVINASYDQPRKLCFAELGETLDATLYTSDTVLPPSCFRTEKITADGGEITLPPHSFVHLKLKA